MKRIYFLLILGSLLLMSKKGWSAPGDTTWVQSHTDVQMGDHPANFDVPVAFPSGALTYRKIYMIFELGKYQCPGSPQYCYDWDYTVSTVLMTPTGDTLELGRLITPYADHTLGARMPMNWKGKYVYEVTDFASLLKNSAAVRVNFSGWSGGFSATVKFAFIEGVPERTVTGINKLWYASFDYGHGSTPINTALGNISMTAPAGTLAAEAKFTITGHGGDGTANAAEFYPNSYTLNLNNNPLVTQSFWRDNCGYNNFYPQNGTWIYDRGGWCPGDLVHTFSHTLTGITANSNYTLNATFPAYTSVPSSSGSLASYTIQNVVIYYNGLNKNLDASIEDIIAPTNEESHFRENPFVGKPKITIRNSGSTPITSIYFEYGAEGGTMDHYTWNGTLNSLENKTIDLAECASLIAASGTNNKFIVRIVKVNEQTDNDATNDVMISYFDAVPTWPQQLQIQMKTNAQIANGVSENSWTIYDVNDNIVAQRVNNIASKTYLDTVNLGNSTYRLVVNDAGCDGMNWWAFQYYSPDPGAASITVKSLTSIAQLPMKGYFNGDFGCGFTQYFKTANSTGVNDVNKETRISVYPNPAKDNIILNLKGISSVNGEVRILDAVGKLIYTQNIQNTTTTINTSGLSDGLYFVQYQGNHHLKMQTKFIISR